MVRDPDQPAGGPAAAARAAAALVRAERRRIARDLHRTPIQLLAAASLRMQLAAAEGGEPAGLDVARGEIDAAIVALRQMMDALAASELDPEVLADAIAAVSAVGAAGGPGPARGGAPLSIEDAAQAVAAAVCGGHTLPPEHAGGAAA